MLNVHATALVVGDRGIVILGPSGSGKTTLALALVAHFEGCGLFSRLVSDDQILVEARSGRLLASAPAPTRGLAEVHGIGPRPIAFVPTAVIDLAFRLVPAKTMARFQEPASESIAGCRLACVELAERRVAAALPVVAAWLENPRFDPD